MINYALITKPGIILGNLVTVAAGFLLASKGVFHVGLFFATLLGLGLIMASACVFNNYIDRNLDQKMQRTKNRALAIGAVNPLNALLFATTLVLLGILVLFAYTNPLTVFIAIIGFLVYVLLYSLWKSRTIYGTAIGSVAGAVPPVVGYCAVSNTFDAGACIFFAMLVLWQMPHFFAIAIFRFDDYTAANIPVLPIVKGMYITKIRMTFYIMAFIAACLMLTLFNYTGYLYFITVVIFGLIWLALCLKGFSSTNDQLWGRRMFQFSLILITAICFIIPFDVI